MPSRFDKFKAAVDELERQVGGATDRAERLGRNAVARTRRRADRTATRARQASDETVDRVKSVPRRADRAAERARRGADQGVERVEAAGRAADERADRVKEQVEAGAESAARTADRGGDAVAESVRDAEQTADRVTRAGSDRIERVRDSIEREQAAAASVASRVESAGRRRVRDVRDATTAARDEATRLSEDIKAADEIAGASSPAASRPTATEQPPDGESEPSLDAPQRSQQPEQRPDQPRGADVGLDPEAADQLAADVAAQDDRIDESDIAGFERVQPDQRSDDPIPRDAEPTYRAELTEDARRDIARQQIAEQNPDIDAGDIERLEPTDDGAYQAVLTDEARRDLAEAPAEPQGGPLDADRLFERTSPASKIFQNEARENAIEAEARQGSLSAGLFVGGEAIEAVGVDVSRAAEDYVPDPDFLEESQEVPVVTSFGRTTVDVNPKLGVGREGTRPGEAVRNFLVDTPAGVGVVTALGPRAAGDAGLRAEDALGRDVDAEAKVTASETVEGLESAGGTVVEGARQDPVGAALDLALPFAVSKASPVRIRSRRVPLDADSVEGVDATASVSRSRRAGAQFEARAQGSPDATDSVDLKATEPTPAETVTTVRLETPAALKPITGLSRGRTVAGFRGNRPTAGAPEVDPSRVDFEELPGRTRTFEPADPVRTDVFQATGRSAGGQTAARTEATRRLVSEAATESPGGRSVGSAEEIVESARAAPSDKAPEIVEALDDTDATIFGSAAARAQVDRFRQPADIDVIVPDKQAARQRFDKALEGANADVDDVFDIKETGDAPGRARGGERIKFGRESFGKLQTDEGIGVNPVEEELLRKAGASGFFRPAEAGGTSMFDVGPEPRRAGRADIRQKDPADAVALADEVLGPENAAVREFRAAFDDIEGIEPPTMAPTDPTGTPTGLRGFIADDRGQVALAGGGRRAAGVLDRPTGSIFDDIADSPTRSPARRVDDLDSPARSPVGSPATSPVAASPRTATGSPLAGLSPAAAGDSPPAGQSPVGSPSPGAPSSPLTSQGSPGGPPPSGGGPPPGGAPPPEFPPPPVFGSPSPGSPGRFDLDFGRDERDEPIPLFDDVETPFVNPIVSGLEESFDSVLGAGDTNTLNDVFSELDGQAGDPLAGDPLEDL
jgi:hypothetical protein